MRRSLRYSPLRALLYVLLLMAMGGLSDVALSETHYIRAGAAGARNGSDWANAWSSFAQVSWIRGDTYFVASGIYAEDVSIGKAEQSSLWIVVKKAIPLDHGSEVGWNSAYGEGAAEIRGRLAILNSYTEVDGQVGSDNQGHGFRVVNTTTGGRVIELEWEKSHIHLRHTEARGTGSSAGTKPAGNSQEMGLYVIGSAPRTDIEISHCWIHRVNRDGAVFGGFNGSPGLLFEYNRLEDTGHHPDPDAHGQGIQFAIYTRNSGITIRYNKFIDISGSANIAFLGGTTNDNVKIYGNLFWSTNSLNTSSPGVIWTREGTPEVTMNDLSIYNNTFHKIALAQVRNDAAISVNAFVRNNLWEESGFTTSAHIGVVADHNYYFNNYALNYNNLNDRSQRAPILLGPTDKMGTSSTFLNAQNFNYQLVAGGLAVDTGIALGSPYDRDLIGQLRPVGTSWDIGAYEYRGSSPPLAPKNLSVDVAGP